MTQPLMHMFLAQRMHQMKISKTFAESNMISITRVLLSAVACLCVLTAEAAYPDRPITLVVPQPAGGQADSLARALGIEMGRRMGVPVIIENKSGASGLIATTAVVRAKADGYTLLLTNSTPILTVPFMFARVPYDVQRDLHFVSQIAGGPLVLLVRANLPANNMAEFLRWAEKNKGSVTYGSFGIGTSGHLDAAYLDRSRNLNMSHLPYKGEAPMVQDLSGGSLDWGLASISTAISSLQGGRVRALAVLDTSRASALPNVPTMSEAGLNDPEFNPLGWFAMMAPIATPVPILQRIEKEAREAVASPSVQSHIRSMGMYPIGNSSIDFQKEYKELSHSVKRMIELTGVKQE